MKIYIDNVDWNSRSGPNTFANRIAIALANRGHILADKNDYDVALCFIEPTYNVIKNSKPFVLRLDGIWFAPNEFETKNINIKSAYYKANAIIFQSNFDKTFITNWWGLPQNYSIINNGIDIEYVNKIISNNELSFDNLRQQYEKILICSANWHPQKRLNSNYDLLSHIRNDLNINACLIVMGSNPHPPQQKSLIPHVFPTGNLLHEICLKYYSMCDYMLHMAFLDHSPNVIVECLSTGTPVICSEDGGTKELLHGLGQTIKECTPYKNELIYYDNPPKIDVSQVFDLKTFNDEQKQNTKKFLDINRIAQNYESVFKTLV